MRFMDEGYCCEACDQAEQADSLPCGDCGICTATIGEFYMVCESIWQTAMLRGGTCQFLCIDCLERRIGRRLRGRDFTDCALNFQNLAGLGSHRLVSRMMG
jgi:hypothetical protein